MYSFTKKFTRDHTSDPVKKSGLNWLFDDVNVIEINTAFTSFLLQTFSYLFLQSLSSNISHWGRNLTSNKVKLYVSARFISPPISKIDINTKRRVWVSLCAVKHQTTRRS